MSQAGLHGVGVLVVRDGKVLLGSGSPVHWAPVIQVRHHVDNAHSAVEHLGPDCMPERMWSQTINLTVWAAQRDLL